MVLKILTVLEKNRIAELKLDLNKEIESKKEEIRCKELKRWNKKYTEGNNSGLEDSKEQISDLDDRVMESTETKQQTE